MPLIHRMPTCQLLYRLRVEADRPSKGVDQAPWPQLQDRIVPPPCPPLPPPQTFRVKSFGCQMNVYDGERMGELLAAQGMSAAPRAAMPIWSCSTPATSARRPRPGSIRTSAGSDAKDGTRPLIAVAGCVAQAEGEEIMRARPRSTMVVGPQAYHRLPETDRRGAGRGAVRSIPTCPPTPSSPRSPPRRRSGPSAFLTVQEGCDKFCTYCVVPYTRGAEICRPFARSDRRSAQRWSRPARRKSPCSARTSTPGRRRRQGPRRRARRADPRACRSARPRTASATPPATPPT